MCLQMYIALVYILCLSVRHNSQQQIKDRLDATVSKDSENAAVSFAARKNKTHCMTNVLVIHSQSIAGFDSMEYSTWQIFAKFVSLEYLLKSVCWISAATKGPEYSSYSQLMSMSYWSSLYNFFGDLGRDRTRKVATSPFSVVSEKLGEFTFFCMCLHVLKTMWSHEHVKDVP